MWTLLQRSGYEEWVVEVGPYRLYATTFDWTITIPWDDCHDFETRHCNLSHEIEIRKGLTSEGGLLTSQKKALEAMEEVIAALSKALGQIPRPTREQRLEALKKGDSCVVVGPSGSRDVAHVVDRDEKAIHVRTSQFSVRYTFDAQGWHPDMRLDPLF